MWTQRETQCRLRRVVGSQARQMGAIFMREMRPAIAQVSGSMADTNPPVIQTRVLSSPMVTFPA
jgi:hypothetical protein